MENMPDILFASTTVGGGSIGLWVIKKVFANYSREKKVMKEDISHTKEKVIELDSKVDVILSILVDKK